MQLKVYTALHHYMLNKEIFIKKEPPPITLNVQRMPHLARFHNNSLSKDLQYPFALFTYSLLSFCLSVFCPSDTRLCGTDTWASSKAVSSKCITTEAVSFSSLPLFSPLFPQFVAVIFALQLVLALFSIRQRWCIGLLKPHYHFLPPGLHSKYL